MRLPNWPEKLNAAIEQARANKFVWGQNDCCIMSANMILAMTGQDPAASLRGTYSTAEQAAKILADAGGMAALISSIAATMGYPRGRPANARRGDLMMYTSPTTGQPAMGICVGRDAVFPRIGGGLQSIQVIECDATWRVI